MASTTPKWTFLTNHGQLLLCIAGEPGLTLREIGDLLGVLVEQTQTKRRARA